jgi:hypothetical protein
VVDHHPVPLAGLRRGVAGLLLLEAFDQHLRRGPDERAAIELLPVRPELRCQHREHGVEQLSVDRLQLDHHPLPRRAAVERQFPGGRRLADARVRHLAFEHARGHCACPLHPGRLGFEGRDAK